MKNFLIPFLICMSLVSLTHFAFADSPVTAPIDAGSASVLTGSGSAGSASAATPDTVKPPTVDQATKLWRGGAFLSAAVLVLYLLLTLIGKLDKRHALYISAGLAGLAVLVDAIQRGDTPTLGMLVSAFTTGYAIVTKGPEKKATA